jgi:hypothetical protein
MSLHDNVCGQDMGHRKNQTTAGEGRTLVAILADVDVGEVNAYVTVALVTCPECGRQHLLVDKDVGPGDGIQLLNNAIGCIILTSEG